MAAAASQWPPLARLENLGSRGSAGSDDSSEDAFGHRPVPLPVDLSASPPVSASRPRHSLVARLAAVLPRPGGLLDSMRQRGVLPSASGPAITSPSQLRRVVPAFCTNGSAAAPSIQIAPGAPAVLTTPSSAASSRCVKDAATTSAAQSNAKADSAAPPITDAVSPRSFERPNQPKRQRPVVPLFTQAENQELWVTLKQIPLPAPDAADNYEISDKEEDSDLEDPDRSGKHVPEWSLRFLEAVEKQEGIDPDTIFGSRVPTCDLEVIFKDADYTKRSKERPRRKRGSSGQWDHDKLSSSEVTAYKTRMGHVKRWRTSLQQDSGGSLPP